MGWGLPLEHNWMHTGRYMGAWPDPAGTPSLSTRRSPTPAASQPAPLLSPSQALSWGWPLLAQPPHTAWSGGALSCHCMGDRGWGQLAVLPIATSPHTLPCRPQEKTPFMRSFSKAISAAAGAPAPGPADQRGSPAPPPREGAQGGHCGGRAAARHLALGNLLVSACLPRAPATGSFPHLWGC